VVIDNLRTTNGKPESEVSNYYKLEKKFLTSLFFLRRKICSKRYFLWFEMENSFRNIGKRSRRAEVLSAQLKTLGLNIKEDYFKITNLAAGKKTGRV
jgi:hypothetical protein